MVRKAIWKTACILFAEREKRRKYSAKDYAIPASGKVMQGFQKNGQGVFVQTATNAKVESVNEGLVVFAGKKRNLEIQFKFNMQMVRSHGMQT